MRFRSVAIKLTIFTLFTGTVTILLASTIGNFTFFRSRYHVRAVFTDVTGLLNNDAVTLSGVTVGAVKGTRVEKGLAVVDLAVDRSLRIPRSTHIEIRYRNLIGLRVVDLQPGDGGAPYLKDGDTVPVTQTQGPLDLDKVFNNLRPLLTGLSGADLNTLSKALVLSLAQHKDDIDAVLADTATFLGQIAGRSGDLGSLIDNVSTVTTDVASERDRLERLLSSFASIATTLAGDSGALDRVLTNLNTTASELGRLIHDNRASLGLDIDNLVTVLQLVVKHQADLAQIANHLDDQLRATLKAMSYGEWANLYVPAFCVTVTPGCDNAPRPAASGAAGAGLLWPEGGSP